MSILAAAERVEVFNVSVAAGTLSTAPQQDTISFPAGDVIGLEIVIPDGHLGLTGIQLAQAHAQTIPRTVGAFIIGNDEVIRWPTAGFLNNGQWQTLTFNTDAIAHSFQIRFLISELGRKPLGPALAEPIPLSVLNAAAGNENALVIPTPSGEGE